MGRRKIDVKIKSHGIYTKWNRSSRELPRILEFTKEIPAKIDIEFGYILEIKKAKGKKLAFRIDHPPFKDSKGNIAPPFEDELFITSNDYSFFLGDTVWPPAYDKVGPWTLTTFIEGEQVAQMTLNLIDADESAD